MQYEVKDEAQLKFERRQKAKKRVGQGLEVCGKICVVTSKVTLVACGAAIAVTTCLLSCMPGDSIGMGGGGGGGISIGFPGDS
jgi:hypothetical protein